VSLWLIVAVIVVLSVLATAVRVLREDERGVVFRLGRPIGVKGPGLVVVLPILDRLARVSLRPAPLDVSAPDLTTRDGVAVTVRAVVSLRVMDPRAAVLQAGDHRAATAQVAQTALRSVVGQVALDDLLGSRVTINRQLQRVIDEQTDAWGVKVTSVEIESVQQPQAVQPAPGRTPWS